VAEKVRSRKKGEILCQVAASKRARYVGKAGWLCGRAGRRPLPSAPPRSLSAPPFLLVPSASVCASTLFRSSSARDAASFADRTLQATELVHEAYMRLFEEQACAEKTASTYTLLPLVFLLSGHGRRIAGTDGAEPQVAGCGA
jgi:hypothetical protein